MSAPELVTTMAPWSVPYAADRGVKLHVLRPGAGALRDRRAVCGLRSKRGWELAMSDEPKCARCAESNDDHQKDQSK